MDFVHILVASEETVGCGVWMDVVLVLISNSISESGGMSRKQKRNKTV